MGCGGWFIVTECRADNFFTPQGIMGVRGNSVSALALAVAVLVSIVIFFKFSLFYFFFTFKNCFILDSHMIRSLCQ